MQRAFRFCAATSFRTLPSLRTFTSVRRSQPFVLKQLENGRTQVTFADPLRDTAPLGTFPTEHASQFSPGFTLEPNPREEPEILIPKPGDFEENPEFWPRISKILKEVVHLDPYYSDLVAAETRTQFFHIYDLRFPPVFGRIPEVEDILGTVELEFSPEYTKIVPHSFQANSMYRPVTQYGAMLLPPSTFSVIADRLSVG